MVQGTKRVYAGINDMGAEILKPEVGTLICTHNRKIWFWPIFPKFVLNTINAAMLKDPEAMRCLINFPGLKPSDFPRQFMECRMGGLDDEPDITPEGEVNYSEYVSCSKRGVCPFEGKLCLSLKVQNGIISSAEMAVLKLSNEPIKIIAGRLFITEETVKTHLSAIKRKIGVKDKTGIALFAQKKGLIDV